MTDPSLRAGDAPDDISLPEAVTTLRGAIERAGPPWSFIGVEDLGSADIDPANKTWPVFGPEGQLLGLVVREPGGSDRHDELIRVLLRTVRTLEHAEAATAAAERRAEAAEAAARVDGLTGLPNHRAWWDGLDREWSRQRRTGRTSAILVIDLDRLKETNDTRGHLEGDRLLRETARVLRTVVRDGDLVARIGGDEFAVLAVDLAPANPTAFALRVRAALDDAGIESSVGAKLCGPTDSLSSAFAEADRRMYLDKRRRKEARRTVVDLTQAEDRDPTGHASDLA